MDFMAICGHLEHFPHFGAYAVPKKSGYNGSDFSTEPGVKKNFNRLSSAAFQTFGYTHFWSTDNSTNVSKRSGNPGYQHGKPVLAGNLKKNETGINWFIQRDEEPFLTMMKTHLDCLTADVKDRLAKIKCIIPTYRYE
jgi:hypothetical protein